MRKFTFNLIGVLFIITSYSQEIKKTEFEVFGHVMMDAGYNFNQVNPNYFDVMRPTQLPAYENEYGTDGNIFYSVRQSLFGFESSTPSQLGDITLLFSFDLFGLGADVGLTTFHMLSAYVEIGKIGFGHNWSLFSDIGGFPNMIEYWGPVGISLCKNVQLRFIPIQGDNRLAFALEEPGASTDQGIYADRIALEEVEPRFIIPDLTAEYRMTRSWGYVELAGVVRRIEWIDIGNDPYDLSGKAIGWGLNFSTNIKLGQKSKIIGQTVFGHGIQNYMNDAPTDIGIENNFDNPNSPVKGVVLPVGSFSLYFNHNWNEKFTSTIGYSAIYIDNSDGQDKAAFKNGEYASTNLLYHPLPNMFGGIELQWISRDNFNDGWSTSATKIQVSLKYKFMEILNKN